MNLQKNRSQISRVNNAQGKNFENQIMSACLGYLYEGRACIDKIPEPFGVSKKDQQTGMFKGRFFGNKKAQPDFQGTLKGGKSIIFEAKTTTKDKISLKVLSSHQEALLEKHYQLGAITAVCVGINNDFYFVPYALWRLCKEQWDRQYFTKEDLKEYKVRFNGAVNFLDFVNGNKVEFVKEFVKG
jgi:penicillin-binding protein-related factor A (putative recombinase)